MSRRFPHTRIVSGPGEDIRNGPATTEPYDRDPGSGGAVVGHLGATLAGRFGPEAVPGEPARSARSATPAEPGQCAEPGTAHPSDGNLGSRMTRLENQNRRLRHTVIVLVLVTGFLLFDHLSSEGIVVQRTTMESKELKLLDEEGNPRLLLGMYSKVPLLQMFDAQGEPRMSLGLRFDDAPFIDLSDRHGRTRVTLEIDEDDAAALKLLDERGELEFQAN